MISFYRVEIVEIIIGMRVERRHMPCLLVPVAVVVVGHDGDPVQVPGEAGDVVAHVNDLLTRGDGGGEEQPAGLEGGAELGHEGGEGWLVFVALLLTICLPARGILPVQVEPVKVVFLDELDGVLYKPPPGLWTIDQATVFVTLAVIPASDGKSHLDSPSLQVCQLLIIFCKEFEFRVNLIELTLKSHCCRCLPRCHGA